MLQDKNRQNGFTLIELIVTVAIISILAAIALPAYDRYTRNTMRTTAKGMLENIHSMEESFFVNNKTYSTDLTALGYNASPLYINRTGEPTAAASSVYLVSVTGCPIANCYSITAVPQNGQTEDTECGTLTLNSLGQKNATGAKGVDCW